MSSPPLELQDLSRNFGGLQAVDRVSLTVAENELRVIIGPNGAGKTTFFNLISGLIQPSGGRIRLFGQDVTRMPSERRAHLGLGRTFQITTLFPELTVLQNVFLASQAQKRLKFMMHRPVDWEGPLLASTRELLREWGLWDKKNVKVKTLSYGEQRQIDIILALVQKPRLLLLDEPTAGLSRAETNAVTEIVRTLGRDHTILMIEHDMEVAFSLAKRITVLHEGKVFADGVPEEIRGNPRVKEIYLGEEVKVA